MTQFPLTGTTCSRFKNYFYGLPTQTCFISLETAAKALVTRSRQGEHLDSDREGQDRLGGMRALRFLVGARIKTFFITFLLAGSCIAQPMEVAIPSNLFDLDIGAMNAADALNTLAEQTNSILLFPYQDVQSHKTNALNGRYDLLDALTILLNDTGLEGGISGNGVIRISLTESDRQNQENMGSRNMNRKKGLFAAVLGIFAAETAVVPAVAQGSSSGVLEEIIITSRRYEESINDAPLAVNVLDSSYLKAQGVDTFSDALQLTPGATWGHYTMAQPGHTLRGMESYNSGNATLESSVQVVVDGVALTKAFMMSPPVYDTERVEIMRGPQGTTFGRNASLGIAHFVTARPSQEFSASANASLGTRGYGGFGGHITGGLTEDLSVRVAVNKKAYDGDLEDEATGAPLEGEDSWAMRASVLYEPSDDFSAYLKAEHIIDRGRASARRHGDCENPNLNQTDGRFSDASYIPSCNPWLATISPEPEGGYYQNRDMTHLTTELSWVRGDLNITSVTGYQWGEHAVLNDIFSSPAIIQDQHVENDATVWSTELRIDNHGSDASVRWLAGIYLLEDEEFRLENNTAIPDRKGDDLVTVNRIQSSITAYGWSETSSQALFGEVAFDLGERTELAVGGRYTNEKKSYDFTNECFGRAGGCNFPTPLGAEIPGYEEFYVEATDCNANIVGTGATATCGTASNPMGIGVYDPLHISKSWDDFSMKLSLNHELNANHNVYALYSEAFKSGGFHHDARSVGQFYESVLDPENVENFEVGLKGSYDTVRYAITAFVMEQINAQSSSLVPDGQGGYLTALSNLGGIEQQGIEFEGTWLATDNLLFGGNFAFYDGELGAGSAVGFDVDDDGEVIFADVSGLATGMDLTWVLYAEHTTYLDNGGTVSVRIDNQHRGKIAPPAQFAEFEAFDGSLEYERPAIDNLGASITWRAADERMTVKLWGKNMLNELDYGGFGPNSGYYFSGSEENSVVNADDSITRFGMPVRNHWGRARYGVDVSFDF